MTHSRRSFFFAAVAGGAIGATWSGALVYSQRVHHPRLDVIGDDQTQFALLDTGDHRVLFAPGPPSAWLEHHLAAMIGPFRRSIDLVIADRAGVAALRRSATVRIDATSWMEIASAQESGSPYGDFTISRATHIVLSGAVTLTIEPSLGAGGWLATIDRGELRIALAPRLELLAWSPSPPLVGIAPSGNLRLALRQQVAEALVCNAGMLEGPALDVPWVRTFAETPARIAIGRDVVEMPAWLERPRREGGSNRS
jgi:hypothetical protein